MGWEGIGEDRKGIYVVWSLQSHYLPSKGEEGESDTIARVYIIYPRDLIPTPSPPPSPPQLPP